MMNEIITFTDDNANTGAANTNENDPPNDVTNDMSNDVSNDNPLNSSETKMDFSESSTSEMMDTDINAGLPAFERYSATNMMRKAAAIKTTNYGTSYTGSNDFTNHNNYNGKGKNKESHDSQYGPDLEGTFMASAEPIREEKPRTASSMLFGRQQDVAGN